MGERVLIRWEKGVHHALHGRQPASGRPRMVKFAPPSVSSVKLEWCDRWRWKYSPETMGGRGWVGGNGWKKILYEYIVQCCMGPKKFRWFSSWIFFLLWKRQLPKRWLCLDMLVAILPDETGLDTVPYWAMLVNPLLFTRKTSLKREIDHQVAGVIDHQVSPQKIIPKGKSSGVCQV